MDMITLTLRRLTRYLPFLLLASVRLAGQQLVLPSLPVPLGAKEALYGSISPDGRSFVYEVIEGDERLLWMLDLASHQAQRLTAAPGVRYQPVWAPDSKYLAYWRSHPLSRGRDGSEGLYVADADARTERRLVTPAEDDAGFSGDVTWLSDGRILYRQLLDRPNLGGMPLRTELLSIRPDGSGTRKTTSSTREDDAPSVSPSGSRTAYIDSCCGGERRSLWVRTSSGARCIAGPIVPQSVERSIVWTRDEKRLYFVAREVGGTDSVEHAYAVDLDRSSAWRIGPIDRVVASVSVSDSGDVALTVMPDRGRVGSLWILPASSVRRPTPSAERLAVCPPIDETIADFVRRSSLPGLMSIDPLLEDAVHKLTVYSVVYAGGEVPNRRMLMHYGSRIGWIGTGDSCHSLSRRESVRGSVACFPLRVSDSYLFSDSLTVRLKTAWDAGDFWRLFLIRNAATPIGIITREVRHNPHDLALVALENPNVTSDSGSFDARLDLAALEDTLAMALVSMPSVRNDPERLTRVASLPMYRTSGQAEERVVEQLQKLMPTLVAKTQALSEEATLQSYMALGTDQSRDTYSLRIRLLRSVSATRDRTVLALESVRSPSPRDGSVDVAQTALARLGTTAERELLEAISRAQAGELPGSLPRFIVSWTRRLPWRVFDAISRLDERFAPSRDRATLELASSPSTPDSVLICLWEGLSRHRDPALSESLLERATTDRSRAMLGALASLDTVWYGLVVQRAIERLGKLGPEGTSQRVPHRPTILAQEPREAPDSLAPGAWMQGDQCLAPDDWSEQLRRSIGSDARLLAGNWLCVRAAEALDIAFDLPVRYDSAYVFRDGQDYVVALPPSRPDLNVTLVRFDTAFVERSRSVARVH